MMIDVIYVHYIYIYIYIYIYVGLVRVLDVVHLDLPQRLGGDVLEDVPLVGERQEHVLDAGAVCGQDLR